MNQEVAEAFIQSCTTLTDTQEQIELTIRMSEIVYFYIDRLGIGPVIDSWEEIRETVQVAVDRAKKNDIDNRPLVIRLTGGGVPTWLVLRIYAAVVYECDSIFYVGDVAVRI